MPFVAVKEGRIRAHTLEFNAVEHCNYGCSECSHFSPYLRRRLPGFEAFRRDLAALADVYHVQRLRFVGGEPLLRKDLSVFFAEVRRSGIADSIEICTNGSLLHTVGDELFRSIDRLSISWYPDERCDQGKVDLAKRKCAQFGVDIKVERIDAFRTMQVDRPIDDDGLVGKIYRSCMIAHTWSAQTFYEGRFYICSRPLFANPYLEKVGIAAPDLRAADGCPLHEPDLLARLVAYMSRETPIRSCKHCLGTVGKYVPWRQLPPGERKAPSPPDRDIALSVSRVRLAFLLVCARIERAVLRVLPSQRLSRAFSLAKMAVIRD